MNDHDDRDIVFILPEEINRMEVPSGFFIWRHSYEKDVLREESNVIFPLDDSHSEWDRIGMEVLKELRELLPEKNISILTPTGLPICGSTNWEKSDG